MSAAERLLGFCRLGSGRRWKLRPYTDDVVKTESFIRFKPVAVLAEAYAQSIPARNSPVIFHCRTGHQASQTWFVLTRMLGYTNIKWYDAGRTEWAARPEFPVE